MQKAFEQVTGKAANSFHQSDVPDLHGKTAIVTGGTGGIGFEVARGLALAKARVILVSRKSENGEEALKKIHESANMEGGGTLTDITFIECDLGDLKHVKKVADQLSQQEERLDILVCDAGVGVNKFDTSADGIDRHFAVNHLGHFLLVNRLLPLIRKTEAIPGAEPARIVVVSSELHRSAPSGIHFASVDEINNTQSLGGGLGEANSLYARSKLANILFVKGLVKKVLIPNDEQNKIYVIATHPGAVHTGQQDQFKEAYGKVFGTVMKYTVVPFMRSPTQGSLSTIWAAVADDGNGNGWQGKYVTDPAEDGKESDMAKDEILEGRLWKLSENIITEKLGPDGLLPWNQDVNGKIL
ncbi:NAD(P)-binding domain superfamily protein [Abortiporus biennis]